MLTHSTEKKRKKSRKNIHVPEEGERGSVIEKKK